MPLVCVSRTLPTRFDCPGAEIRFGPDHGVMSGDELRAFVKGADAIVSWFCDRVTDEVIAAAGPQLKIIANYAVGYENIDLAAARRRGIIVTNTPDAVTEGTADMAWALLLAAARRLIHADRFARSGEWATHGILGPSQMIGASIAGRTLFIVGAGRIGRATALRSLGWGMRTLYFARTPKPEWEFAPLNARRVELDEGLREADFVSLHTPLNESTRHLIDARRLALMKPSAVLINTSRGPVIDESALADALKKKTIAAAGLDVFENEPRLHPDLAALDNLVTAPHIGSATVDSRRMMTDLCAANIRAVLNGKPPLTPVPV
ncbi:MAG: D-glycerate dehydrogenase [Phycisphaerae bacterium]|nr:D-glycerate dehydrogenase [Phycisphaerae bacterium]